MAIKDIFAAFEDIDFIPPRAFYSSRSFNDTGTSLRYYIHGLDSQGNTLLFAGELLWDAEYDGWLGNSGWEGGDFKDYLPPSKHR